LYIKTASFFALVIAFVILAGAIQASEPTWLFTVPKAESLKEDEFNIGFIYADLGITNNVELGLHGFKYSVPNSSFAFGVSLYPLFSPYLVTSIDLDSSALHLGVKAAPYFFFAGFETPISSKLKLVAELSDGLLFGARISPAPKWTLDIFGLFMTIEGRKYKYGRLDSEDFKLFAGIQFTYSGKL
jgi:hypothetical protein